MTSLLKMKTCILGAIDKAQGIEHMPSMDETLSLIPGTIWPPQYDQVWPVDL